MQNYRNPFFFLLIILFSACSDNSKSEKEKTTSNKALEESSVAFELENIKVQSPICEKDTIACTQVNINYPVFKSDLGKITVETLNEDITSLILKSSLNPEDQYTSIKEACDGFLADYAAFKEQVPSEVPGWEIEIKADVINNNSEYLSIMVSDYSYLGGAHPNQSNQFLNYKVSTGKGITLEDLVKDITDLKKLAEAEFRALKGLSNTDDLNEAGYLFEAGIFQLPEHFGIQNDQLLLYYNNYDIASYAEGRTILKLPLSTVTRN